MLLIQLGLLLFRQWCLRVPVVGVLADLFPKVMLVVAECASRVLGSWVHVVAQEVRLFPLLKLRPEHGSTLLLVLVLLGILGLEGFE